MVQRNVILELMQNFTIGSTVVYYCKNNNSAAKSNCFEGGKWIPDPAEYSCEAIPDSKGRKLVPLISNWSTPLNF